VSYTGTLVYAPGSTASRAAGLPGWIDEAGPSSWPLDPGFYGDLKLSPDGRRIAITC